MNQGILLTFLFPVLFLLFLIVALRFWTGKKLRASGIKPRLQLLQRLPVGQRECLVLVAIDGETMLLGVTNHQINVLSKLRIAPQESGTDVQCVFGQFEGQKPSS